ncbi:MAG: MCE family protein [Deltaproteobacteria bacterium]|nr:MCE family protein [Deltaproteobacteria bacterium]
MSRQGSKTLIGAFVLGAVALVVAGLVVFGSGRLFTKTYKYVMYFDGSVKGLSVGAPVVLRGVKVGLVSDILLLTDSKNMTIQIPVFIEVQPGKFKEVGELSAIPAKKDPERIIKDLIALGLRAQLTLQSIVTGQLMVELDFHPETQIRLVGIDRRYPEIPTIPSPLQKLTKTVERLPIEEIFTKLSSSLSGIANVVNSPGFSESVQAFNLAMTDIGKLIRNIDSRVEPLAISLEETLSATRDLMKHLDRKVEPLTDGLEQTERELQKMLKVIRIRADRLSASIERTSRSANVALIQAEKTLKTISDLMGEDSPFIYELTRTLQQLSAAARSIRVWADYLERHPEALIRGKGGYRGR